MFAIKISEENMHTITNSYPKLTDFDVTSHIPSYYKHATGVTKSDWYFVTGYVNPQGRFQEWAILPQYILEDNFEYNPDTIQTEFDQIVRK